MNLPMQTMNFLEGERVYVLPWVSHLSDLNPIEYMWNIIRETSSEISNYEREKD